MNTNQTHIGFSGGCGDGGGQDQEYNNHQQSHRQQLGVNKNSKSIKKPPSIPQVYNIDKSDFRKIVQHLTGTPNPNSNPNPNTLHRPSSNLPLTRSPSMRLQRIRPPPLSPFPRQCPNPPLEDLQQNAEDSQLSVYTRYMENSNLNTPLSPGTAATAAGGSASPASERLNGLSSYNPALLSPSFKFPPPLSPNFMLSPLSLSGGISGSFLQPLASPGGSLFPSSPSSGFLSPIWGKGDN